MKYIHRFSQGLCMRQVDMLQDGISKSSATLSRMAKKLRHICLKSMRKHRKQKGQRIGGVDVLIHIDESKFCHKRKYARGRFGNTWRRKTWVFGMLEIRGNSRRPVLRLVKRRNKATLVPIIKKHIKPQSTVVSDEWRAYSSLSQEGYRHVKVNHSQNYVDPSYRSTHRTGIEGHGSTRRRGMAVAWKPNRKVSEKAALLHRMDLLVGQKT
ncbi:uncharacterized protein LOC120544944 [Perca fluviatilis]|uniref:uncharacterized protein LOC120544944 n=1 Tax=Perca fluviatilis TaxID=8168 RepID=UPI0019666539|nr:uncharacterized protein LOC120544944 [Perca fluviatilis]